MASNMYLKFEDPGIAGMSTAPGHQGEIEVLSWSQGGTQPTGGSGSVGLVNPQNLIFTKYLDGVTRSLLEYMRSGKQFRKVTITCFRGDAAADNPPARYLTIVMEYVVIVDYSLSGPGDVPVENIALQYGIIHYTYAPQKSAEPAR